MKISLTMLGFAVVLGTVSAQQIDSVPFGANADSLVETVGIRLFVKNGEEFSDFAQERVSFPGGNLQQFTATFLRSLIERSEIPEQVSYSGLYVQIAGRDANSHTSVIQVDHQILPKDVSLAKFSLVKTETGWTLPSYITEVPLKWGSILVPLPETVTDIEIRVRGSGREEIFSTRSNSGGVCELLSAKNGLNGHVLSVDREYMLPRTYNWPTKPSVPRWWTEGEVVYFAGDRWAEFDILTGLLKTYSALAPSFLKLPGPKLAMTVQNGYVELVITGRGGFEIESTADIGGDWETETLTPTTSSDKSSDKVEHRYRLQQNGPNRFYRIKATPSQGN